MILWAAKNGRAWIRLPAWPTRREAIAHLERQLGEPWADAQRHGWSVAKVRLVPAQGDGAGANEGEGEQP